MALKENSKVKNDDKKILRFGVMCSDRILQEWQAICIKKILLLDDVRFSLLIIEDKNQSVLLKKRTSIKDIFSKYSIFHIYRSLIIRPKIEKFVDIEEILKDVPSIKCKVIEKCKDYRYVDEEDIENIKKYNLDFILRFTLGSINGDILNATRYGIWSYCHEQKYREGPPFFWEVYENNPVTEVILQRLSDEQLRMVTLKKGYLKTSKSYSGNINEIYSTSTIWPAQVVRDIFNNNAQYLNFQSTGKKTFTTKNSSIYAEPTNFQMVYYFGNLLKKFIIYKLEKLFIGNQWNIGFVQEPIGSSNKAYIDFKINWLPQKKNGSFVADPFAIKKENQTYIFCEVFDYKTQKGKIATFNFDENNSNLSLKELDLGISCHLSYPYIFEYNNDVYMVPESSEIEQILLYKAVDFPEKWEKVSVIHDNVKAVDSTIFQYQGLWWLFYSDLNFGRHNNLYVWYAQNPLGKWSPHDLNPVKIDVRSSRCAGTPFLHNGILYRPSQDCSEKYGGKISLNKVKKLTPYDFEEEIVRVIEPSEDDPYPKGRHTLSSAGDITIIDGHRSVFIGNFLK